MAYIVKNLESGGCLYTCPTCGLSVKTRNPVDASRIKPHVCAKVLANKAYAAQEKQTAAKQLSSKGPGYYLHRLLKKLTGEDIVAGCGCSSHIAEMNMRGPAWCRENVETIVGWLEEEIDRRLKKAEETGEKPGWRLKLAGWKLPGQRAVMRRVVFHSTVFSSSLARLSRQNRMCFGPALLRRSEWFGRCT